MRHLLVGLLILLGTRGVRSEPASPGIEWRLGRSDFLHYERRVVTLRKGKETLSEPSIVTVHGHDLRAARQYMPCTPTRDDLPAILALRLPAPGEDHREVKTRWPVGDTVDLGVRGTVQVQERSRTVARLAGTWKLASRGKGGKTETFQVASGKATVVSEFDLEEGVVRSARVEIAEVLKKRSDGRWGKASKTGRTYELRLVGIRRARYAEFPKDVDGAIDRGVAHLRTLQQEDGSFKPHANYALGTTALAVLTLAACGVPRTDPALEKALDWMFLQDATKTYERAISLMAIDRAFTPPEEITRAQHEPITVFRRDLTGPQRAWCLDAAADLETSATPGSWGYPAPPNQLLQFDSSNTQYAVLGLRAATRLGYKVEEKTWMGVVRHFRLVRQRQAPPGSISLVRRGEAVPDEGSAHELNRIEVPEAAGFRYATLDKYAQPWGSMTCAGIAALTIARHQLRLAQSHKLTPKLAQEIEALILGGWAWLDAHWGVDRNPEHPSASWHYYYLYSLERAALLSDLKRVGGKDWYFEGAQQLIARQLEDGSWNHPRKKETPPTCFALLFLKRGTSPLSGSVVTKR